MDLFYIKTNEDWKNKVKYGYVAEKKDPKQRLINRLHASTEEHSELSKYINIYSFQKTCEYRLGYKEIDKIISLVISNQSKIQEIEKAYNVYLPFFHELHNYLITSMTKISNEFVEKKV